MDKKNILFVVLFIGILVSSAVLADNSTELSANVTVNSTEFQGKALTFRYQHAACAVNLTDAQIDAIDTYLSGNLSSYKDVLATDLTQLAGFKVSVDKSGFDAYFSSTFNPDIKSSNDAIRDAKNHWRSQNLSNDTKTAFINALKSAISQYAACNNEDYGNYAHLVLNYYDKTQNNWGDNMDRLDKIKGKYNITDPNADFGNVSQDLQDMISKLTDALNSGNTTIMRQALQDIRQQNLHVWARFEQTRLQIYLDQMTDMSRKIGRDVGDIQGINDTIHSLNPYIQPGNKYHDGEYNDVWNTFKNASKDMKQISKDILQQRMQDRNGTGNNTNGPRGIGKRMVR